MSIVVLILEFPRRSETILGVKRQSSMSMPYSVKWDYWQAGLFGQVFKEKQCCKLTQSRISPIIG